MRLGMNIGMRTKRKMDIPKRTAVAVTNQQDDFLVRTLLPHFDDVILVSNANEVQDVLVEQNVTHIVYALSQTQFGDFEISESLNYPSFWRRKYLSVKKTIAASAYEIWPNPIPEGVDILICSAQLDELRKILGWLSTGNQCLWSVFDEKRKYSGMYEFSDGKPLRFAIDETFIESVRQG